MDKVENSARKTGRDQFLVGCQCEKEGDTSLITLHSATQKLSLCRHPHTSRRNRRRYASRRTLEILTNARTHAKAELAERGAIARFKGGKR